MDLSQFKRILMQVFLLPVFALLLMAVALYLDIRSATKTTNQLVQTDARIAQTTLVTKLIIDEETGLRGYQTTGDPIFLEPYNKAEPALAAEFSALEGMPGSDQSQIDHIHHLKELHATWHDGFAGPVIAEIRNGGTRHGYRPEPAWKTTDGWHPKRPGRDHRGGAKSAG